MPKYMYLDLPYHVLRNTARFRLRVHTLQIEQAIRSNSVPVPWSALSVKSMPLLLSTTSLQSYVSHRMPCLAWERIGEERRGEGYKAVPANKGSLGSSSKKVPVTKPNQMCTNVN
eukprot:1143554-Pelagomonas_calceolata.AAC.2